ncbi:MAG: aminotransferase class III-fold pyridoxal phosphate-dependent enzyme [Planctomycetota bacterium]|nr:MAG: aminotransferase class III-fold pyridoxal phosphate-dependent enzyme [Planctomycetota bacterium]
MSSSVLETCQEIIDGQIPNLFRVYINPHVAQCCFCLSRYVSTTWPEDAPGEPAVDRQIFLANGLEEAFSGATKLARYVRNLESAATRGLLIDPDGLLPHFAKLELPDGQIEFIPELTVARHAGEVAAAAHDEQPLGFVAVVPAALAAVAEPLGELLSRHRPVTILGVSRACLGDLRSGRLQWPAPSSPDVVVFDESFVDREVPFAAFAARREHYDHWQRAGMTTFHSTTFQPNTISSRHLVRCLEAADPEFRAEHAAPLRAIAEDRGQAAEQFARYYSPSLRKVTAALGFDREEIQARGHHVQIGERRIFDGVAGVACSVRGHNPESYVEEIEQLADEPDIRGRLGRHLHELTGIEHFAPAVSGASAVESALKLALAAAWPKQTVLALGGGFGGKTLFALTGTARPYYKSGLAPLYPHVVYVDPFAADAVEQLTAALKQHPVAVVQAELVQGVGGVREIPRAVLEFLDAARQKYGYYLFCDEVQTGMFRTGPFVRARHLDITPDLMTIGKGTSDMMFPFAVTLYNEAIRTRMAELDCPLLKAWEAAHGYRMGYLTATNVIERAQDLQLSQRVAHAGRLLAEQLAAKLRGCRSVRDVRVFGMLIGIELEYDSWRSARLRKLAHRLYLLAMTRHRTDPLLMGFCQYEPHIFKLTPPLTITDHEIDAITSTIAEVLRIPLSRLLAMGARALAMGVGAALQSRLPYGRQRMNRAVAPRRPRLQSETTP